MTKVLVTWVGQADRNASEGKGAGIGPVAQALASRDFDRAVLLSNYDASSSRAYLAWLKKRTKVACELQLKPLRSPTHLEDIYLAVTATLQGMASGAKLGELTLTFHTSPGTGPMAAVWIILARSAYPAELLTSSLEHGVSVLEAPFDLAAEFVAGQVSRFEAALDAIVVGRPPAHAAFDSILHQSAAMGAAIERALSVAKLSAPVLLEGESGTGKELVAKAIHEASERSGRPFVAVNCGAIPRELVQSSLFGHQKGAFTGATSASKGHFGEAHGGTLFLDEVGELPLAQQVLLLRALQERKVLPVGATREVEVDVRVIAATHRKLRLEVEEGRFREDLYYRLAMLVIRLPPLRERAGDVGLLIDRLLPATAARIGSRTKKLSSRARALLLNYRWPGNVRELEGVLARALAWSKGDTIDEDEMREALLMDNDSSKRAEVLGRALGTGFSLEQLIDEVAKHYLSRAHNEARGVKRKAADLLGFEHYQTYDNWYRKHVEKS